MIALVAVGLSGSIDASDPSVPSSMALIAAQEPVAITYSQDPDCQGQLASAEQHGFTFGQPVSMESSVDTSQWFQTTMDLCSVFNVTDDWELYVEELPAPPGEEDVCTAYGTPDDPLSEAGLLVQCAWARAGAQREYQPDGSSSYRVSEVGGGSSYLLGGSASVSGNYGEHCSWAGGVSGEWSCLTPERYDTIGWRQPGTRCHTVHTISISWFVVEATSVALCP